MARRLTLRSVVITDHALRRYQHHHPDATRADVFAAVQQGRRLDGEMAMRLMRRKDVAHRDDVFVLARDRRGLFIVDASRRQPKLTTYARFSAAQVERAQVWFGPGD